MRVWQGISEVPSDLSATTVTIGTFDGVHRGHKALLDAVVADGASSVAVTFDPHPMTVLAPSAAPALLATLAHRLELIQERGVEGVLVLNFTAEFANQSPEDFILSVLVETLQATHVIVGSNFRFGRRGSGDVELLEELGDREGFTVAPLSLLDIDQTQVSSTAIRQLIASGQVEKAAAWLGHRHRLSGTVISGNRRGRELGFPTANLDPFAELAVPGDGVYAGWLRSELDQVWRPAAISVGNNPTFSGTQRRVEAFVLDAPDSYDVYDRVVDLEFAMRLRNSRHFETVEQLIVQMNEDVTEVRSVLDC